MSKKGQLIYKLITTLTLVVPLPVYLFLQATLFSITPDAILNADIGTVEVATIEDGFLVYSTDQTATMSGYVVYADGKYGLLIDGEDIIKIDKGFYSYQEKDGAYQLTDIKRFEIEKQMSYKVPITFIISAIGVAIVVLIIQGKMQWHKSHPRAATLIALLTGTLILYVVNVFIGSILNVFLVATISWALYCIEYLVQQGKLTGTQADKVESDLIAKLREALKNG